MPADLSTLSNEQLMDMWTPTIFLPQGMPQVRDDVLAENRRIEDELRSRGITRDWVAPD